MPVKKTPNEPIQPKKIRQKPLLLPPPKPAPPVSPEATTVPTPVDQAIVYDRLEIDEYSTASLKGPVDTQWCRDALGWETEIEFRIRKTRENPGTKPEIYVFGEGVKNETTGVIHPVHCRNIAGDKVICWNNANNRPFDVKWCESLIHTVLYGQWAGPFTVPGETVNGETIRISRYGLVISAQHQMTACILAGEQLAKARQDGMDTPDSPKYPVWRSQPDVFIETIVVKGMSQDPRILMTVDYVKPRTASDVFYTSDVFMKAPTPDRQILCKMLANAVATLWTRTDTRGYRTHPEIVGFLDRHPKLLKCVEYMHKENSAGAGRRISKLRISAGMCSALMYIQASSGPGTDSDEYRNESPPSEKNLDWSCWDQAETFWTLLSSGDDFSIVREALGRLFDSSPDNDDNTGLGGRVPEKLAILAAAWRRWKEHDGGRLFDKDDLEPGGELCLSYSDLDDKGKKMPNGEMKLIDVADFEGIDSPEVIDPKRRGAVASLQDPPPPTGEEYERLKEQNKTRRSV